MNTKWIMFAIMIILLETGQSPVEAAYNFTSAQTNPTPVQYTMRSSASPTFRISNTSTTAGARIYQVRFRLSTYNTIFPASIAAPAGWTRTSYSATSVTFRANNWANAILSGGLLDFVLAMTAGYSSADVNQTLRDVRACFTTVDPGAGSWPTCGTSNRITYSSGSSIGLWRLMSLDITGFTITDLAGTPTTSITAGTGFKLVMTIVNRSTTTQSGIISVANPPAPTITGTVTLPGSPATVYSPSPLNLASLASGTITFTYTTQASDAGTVYFTASTRNSGGTATSKTNPSATSPILAVGKFTAALAVTTLPATSPTCNYSNRDLTITMGLTNNYGNAITGIAATALTVSLAGQVTLTSGPNYPSGTTVAAGGTLPVNWTYKITGPTSSTNFYFTGTASGTEQTGGAGTGRNTPLATSNTVIYGGFTVAVNPSTVNANSTNQTMSWTVTNNGCADVKQVQIAIPTLPSTWGLPVSDTYSLIEQYNPPNPGTNPIDPVENLWTVSVSNPVTFASPASPNYVLPLIAGSATDGTFELVFPGTPSSAGTPHTFQVIVMDANNISVTLATDVSVIGFNTAPNSNSTNTGMIREDIR
jgi:hypothetical protein